MGNARTTVAVTVEGTCWAMCHSYPYRTPILSVNTPTAYLTVCGVDQRDVSSGDVDFARDLLRAVQTYVADVEARHDAGAEATMLLPGTDTAVLGGEWA